MNQLRQVSDDLWTRDTLLSLSLGLRLPLRMTVFRLPSGKLVLHNPVAMDDTLAAELAALGAVSELAAPNLGHHLSVEPTLKRFPAAVVRGCPGLAAKKPQVSFASELGDEAPSAYEGVLETAFLRGATRLNEVVFFHRSSRTLVVSDLVFNVVTPANAATAFLLTLTGTRGRLAKSRLVSSMIRDRAAFSASLERVLDWDFDRVLMAHGDPVHEGGHAALARVLGAV